jgi:death on curing protein
MITLELAYLIHTEVLLKHGGANGVRDLGGLQSAIARPYASFGGEFLYKSIYEQAASIGESIIINHPFIDGNKRTGYVLMETILRLGNIKIIANDDELYQFVIQISTGEINHEQIVEWLKVNTKEI